jgi:ParB-like chromosome segregation protein Spo0J
LSTVRIEYVALSKLERWPRNPKTHDLEQLDKSVERFGFVQPLLVDENTGKLIAGHGRLDTLLAMKAGGKPAPERVQDKGGDWLVPVVRGVAFKDEREAEAYLIADNRLVEIGGWDEDVLKAILDDLGTISAGFAGIGWDQAQMGVAFPLLTMPDGGVPEAPNQPTYDIDDAARVQTVVCPHCGKDVPVGADAR